MQFAWRNVQIEGFVTGLDWQTSDWKRSSSICTRIGPNHSELCTTELLGFERVERRGVIIRRMRGEGWIARAGKLGHVRFSSKVED